MWNLLGVGHGIYRGPFCAPCFEQRFEKENHPAGWNRRLLLSWKIFEGPLDLLLYLVSKNKMNIYDIEIVAPDRPVRFSMVNGLPVYPDGECKANLSRWPPVWCR